MEKLCTLDLSEIQDCGGAWEHVKTKVIKALLLCGQMQLQCPHNQNWKKPSLNPTNETEGFVDPLQYCSKLFPTLMANRLTLLNAALPSLKETLYIFLTSNLLVMKQPEMIFLAQYETNKSIARRFLRFRKLSCPCLLNENPPLWCLSN